ncbi:membrane protein [Pseudomonas fluorescens HK44]|uniref:cyclic-guanylate-specific phosphodiesterase n=1 Tax=Pseudomonas fluorescens HK44 TaxID=1042209 RepID=A0A010TEJ6_PSEFL|nr:membrane protein [Pseudomonas fluorescens HK44]
MAAQLQSQIGLAFSETEGIAQLLRVDDAISPEHFRGIAREAIHSVPHISRIAMAPDDVLSDIYPLEGNESVLGLDYRNLTDQYPLLRRSKALGLPVLAGPVALYQGGQALIYRRPIFLSGHKGMRRYWGSVSVLTDIDRLLLAAGIAADKDLDIALRGRDGHGAEGEMIWGKASIYKQQAITHTVEIPGGTWQLAAIPHGGWSQPSLITSPLFWLSLAATALFSVFAAQLSLGHRQIQMPSRALRREMDERRVVEAELLDKKTLLQVIFEHVPSLMYLFNTQGRLLLCNHSFERAMRFSGETMVGRRRESFMQPEDAKHWEKEDDAILASGQAQRFEETYSENGVVRIFLTTKCPVRDAEDKLLGVLGISSDITEIRQTTEQLRLAGVVMDNTDEGVLITDAKGLIISINKAFTHITGYTAEQTAGKTHRLLRSQQNDGQVHEQIRRSLQETGRWHGEVWSQRKNGENYPQWLTVNSVRNVLGEVVNYVAVFSDITSMKHSQAELERLAHYDAVTGLPNRVWFHKCLTLAIEHAQPRQGLLAVLILDLDGFKTVNDSLGHAMGDLLLQQAAQRFTQALRPGDTAARLGGDEFVFILDNLTHVADATLIVQRMLETLHQPFELKGATSRVTGSIGVAIFPGDGSCTEDLVRHADTAMYRAKEAGRNAYQFYQREMTLLIQQRVSLEQALRRALARNEFEIWYQPKLDLLTGQIEGAEALIRWRSPKHGLMSPGEFIPLAERTGLIIQIGEWVLERVCAQLHLWRKTYGFTHRVAVNVAALQIERSDFVETVRQALQRHDLPARALEIEVTESLLIKSLEVASDVLSRLQALGVTIAVDDFGTGHSSLAYLKALPVNNLKIDQTFISDVPHDTTNVAITQAIINLGRALGFTVTAEGIETREQLEFLRNAGCDLGQGYLISQPMPAKEFETWLGAGMEGINEQAW